MGADDAPPWLAEVLLAPEAGEPAHTRAVDLLGGAAQTGLPGAQTRLASLYATGETVAQDYVQAYKWANLASGDGDENAAKLRDTVAKLMTAEQIAEAQRQVRAYLAGETGGAQ